MTIRGGGLRRIITGTGKKGGRDYAYNLVPPTTSGRSYVDFSTVYSGAQASTSFLPELAAAANGNNAMSFAFWFAYYAGIKNTDIFLQRFLGGANKGFQILHMNGNLRIEFIHYLFSQQIQITTPSSTMTNSNWYAIVFTKEAGIDASTVKFYQNKTEYTSAAMTVNLNTLPDPADCDPSPENTPDFFLNRSNNGGRYCEIMAWDHVIDSATIAAFSDGGTITDEPNLLHIPCDEGSGLTLTNKVGSNLTIANITSEQVWKVTA